MNPDPFPTLRGPDYFATEAARLGGQATFPVEDEQAAHWRRNGSKGGRGSVDAGSTSESHQAERVAEGIGNTRKLAARPASRWAASKSGRNSGITAK